MNERDIIIQLIKYNGSCHNVPLLIYCKDCPLETNHEDFGRYGCDLSDAEIKSAALILSSEYDIDLFAELL